METATAVSFFIRKRFMKQKHIDAYMKCCEVFAECSSGVRLKVGSVIVKDNRIISCGYNALPEHIDGPLEYKRYIDHPDRILELIDKGETVFKDDGDVCSYTLATKPEVRHAEINALKGFIRNGENAVGAIMFCTHSCCKPCAIDIVDAGITTFYYKHEYRDSVGLDYLMEHGVTVIKY